jgi:hypothetical protein
MQRLSINGSRSVKNSGKTNLYSQSYIYACVVTTITLTCPLVLPENFTIQLKNSGLITITTPDSQTAIQLQMSKLLLEEEINKALHLVQDDELLVVKVKKI